MRMIFALMAGVLLASSAALAIPCIAQAQPGYSVAMEVPLGNPDRWDYLTFDPASGRVYISHGDWLSVVDGRNGTVVGVVLVPGASTHGIVIAPELGRGYADDGKVGVVKVFELKTLQVTGTLPAAPDADAMARDPKTGRLFVVEGDSHSLTVIDPTLDKVVATIATGEGLEFAVADGLGKLYVNGVDRRDILRIDTSTGAIDARWPIPDCESPHGLAIDQRARHLFVSCVNARLVVVDADSGREVASAPIGQGTDAAAFDPVRHRVLSANGRSGTLSVIQEDGPDRYRLLAELATRKSVRTMAIDPATGRVFLAATDLQPAATLGARPQPIPGSLKLIILDPVR